MGKRFIKLETEFGSIQVSKNKDGFLVTYYDRQDDGKLKWSGADRIKNVNEVIVSLINEIKLTGEKMLQDELAEDYETPKDFYDDRLKEVLEGWE